MGGQYLIKCSPWTCIICWYTSGLKVVLKGCLSHFHFVSALISVTVCASRKHFSTNIFAAFSVKSGSYFHGLVFPVPFLLGGGNYWLRWQFGTLCCCQHDDIITWKYFLHFLHFARGIHLSWWFPLQMSVMWNCDDFFVSLAWTNCWTNSHSAQWFESYQFCLSYPFSAE